MSKPLPLVRHFRKLKDPRLDRRKLHSLETILVIAICAVIAGANDFQQVALFGQKRKGWLERFLALPNGIPSHDTFERVFARLDPRTFQECFAGWMNAWYARLSGSKHLAIDGKAVRGSASPSKGFRCLHLVNVWATQAELCLGLVACDADSNEITALPRLLALLDLEGALVTIDAVGCQKKIAQQVIDGGGDYLLVVKGNQEKLYEEIQACFERAAEQDWKGVTNSYYEKDDLGHGREENRCCLVIEDPEGMEFDNWPRLTVIGTCQSIRKEADGESTFHVRYFIGSKRAKARYYAQRMRGHWRVENNLHWQLDVTFREDASRTRQRTAATNFAVVRRLALNLTRQEDTQMSIAKKRFAAALDADYLEKILEVGEIG